MANRAKTSARSKGYRKTEQKKPFLSKKEIIWLVAIVAAVVLAIVLFNVFYDDGSLKVSGGRAIAENYEDSLLIGVTKGNTKKYYKLGEVGEVEGFRREAETTGEDENIRSFKFYPEQDAGALEYLQVSGGMGGSALALSTNAYANYVRSGLSATAVEELEIDGHKVYHFVGTIVGTDEETGVTSVTESHTAYVQSSFADYSIGVRQSATAKSEPNLDDEGIAAFVEGVAIAPDVYLANLEAVVAALELDKID